MTDSRYRPIDDSEILSLIESGEIAVDLDTAQIFKGSRELVPRLVGCESSGYRYLVEIYWDGGRRGIVRARLVYMAGSRKVIDPGVEIHHLDSDSHNDIWSNLIALSVPDHKKLHAFYSSEEEVPF